tara:strand:- start:49 stop:618 length:570 start_codon:yes stop_codon:yes gene_type:complete
MTELEAVNVLLTTIGEAPISTLSGNQVVDVAIAKQVINEVSREIQSQGWHFNTDDNVELTPDIDGNITISTDIARIDSPSIDVVVRSGKLFNKTLRTFTFETKQKFTIVYYQDFEALPDTAKRYITTRAARIYADRMINSETIHQMISRDEQKALVDLKEFEGDTADYNMMDSYSVSRILNRGFNQRII